MNASIGPDRNYTSADRAFFAEWQHARAEARPRRCTNGARCWVTHGPPSIRGNGLCIECDGHPRSQDNYHAKGYCR